MIRTISFMAAILAAFSTIAAKDSPTRLDVTVQPENAQVFVDGELAPSGSETRQIFGLAPGRHLVHVQAPSYRPVDEFVVLQDGDFVQKSWTLHREKALFLLRTTPEDAEVRYNGVAIGRTPFLSTTLNVGETYTLELVRNGYKPKKIKVQFEGRAPVVRDEALMLDSGSVKCETEPSGATVLVNGVERGVTPLVVNDVPKGRAIVIFRMDGYREEKRELHLAAGDEESLTIPLTPKPATLNVISTPEGAQVYLDDNYLNKTPIKGETVTPGSHKLTLKLKGHRDVEKTILVDKGVEITETIDMENVLGRLLITTKPGGATIVLDGHDTRGEVVRMTRSTKARPGAERSDVLILPDIPAGEYIIVARLAGYEEKKSKKFKLNPQQSFTMNIPDLIQLFRPNIEIKRRETGQILRGIIKSEDANIIELDTGSGYSYFIPKSDIKYRKPIIDEKTP